MKNMKRKNYLFALIALVGVLTLGIVFAATTGLLNFSGTAVISPSAKVVFNTAQIIYGTAEDSCSISPDGQTLDFTVNLEEKNDYTTVYFELFNSGNVPIVLDNLTQTSPQVNGIDIQWPADLNGYPLTVGEYYAGPGITITLTDNTMTEGSYTFSATLNYQQDV